MRLLAHNESNSMNEKNLDRHEAAREYADGHIVEYTSKTMLEWKLVEGYGFFDNQFIQFRLQPTTLVPLTHEDIPPVCWLRLGDTFDKDPHHRLVICVMSHSVVLSSEEQPGFDELQKKGWQYSTDRVNWLPCEKQEVEA